jgi:outer membrane lipoprotein carrier protein
LTIHGWASRPALRLIFAIITLVIIAMPIRLLGAPSGAERLQGFLSQLQTLQADFQQVLLDEKGAAQDQTSGQVYLSRPGRFRWDYKVPHPQIIVADGNQVWLYDVELSQVTVRTQATALADTPAALLSSIAPFEDSFEVKELGEREDGSVWLLLTPRSGEEGSTGNFDGISVGFSGEGELQAMELKDSFGQTTRIRFSAIEHNPELDAELFRFTPPPGVDVIQSQ